MTSVTAELTGLVSAAFEAEDLPPELGRVQRSDRPDLADFQCNGAMAAAKLAKMAPRQIADKICARIANDSRLEQVDIAGPGFINLRVTAAFLSTYQTGLLGDERCGISLAAKPTKVVLDFGGPNIAKPMHVGHLRSSIIGDCLQRLFRFVGDDVVSDVHLGDWGKPIGMLITELKREQPDLPQFDAAFAGPHGGTAPVTMADLERLYPQAAAACRADEARDEEARLATAELQAGKAGYRDLWQHFFEVSKQGIDREFGAMGVTFDLWKGEASVDPLIGPMVEDLKAKGIVEVDDGAHVIRVAEQDDQSDIPPLILLKSDGAATYATTDLATIVDRVTTIDPDLMVYVVDQRQHAHFVQVFRAAEKAGLNGHAGFEHIGFGTMNGPDGKPFKTRDGGAMKLFDLINMMRDKARERLDEAELASAYPEEERMRIADLVGLGALKFADLSNHRLSDYIFDLDRFMRFEGKTGPYLQYAAVRIKSILRRAEQENRQVPDAPVVIESAVSRDLVLKLSEFPEAIAAAYDKRAPNILCDHVYGAAQAFSRFYKEHHVLSESDDALRGSRLGLCQAALTQLTLGLSLLGIAVPDRM